MERNDIDSSLTDKDLIQKSYWWINELIKSGGKSFVMHVPARLDHDTDLVLFNVTKRLENLNNNHEALQARCDRYEKALKQIRFVHKSSDSSAAWHLQHAQNIAIEALNGEGEKEEPAKQWWEGKAISEMPEYVKVIREDCVKDTGLYCKVHRWSTIGDLLPALKGQFGAELIGYEPDYLSHTELSFPGQIYGRLNATHLIPATKEEYEAYTNMLEENGRDQPHPYL
jgi:hypothetical protein